MDDEMNVNIDEISCVTRDKNCMFEPKGLRYVPRSVSELELLKGRVYRETTDFSQCLSCLVPYPYLPVIDGSEAEELLCKNSQQEERDIIQFSFRGVDYYVDVESAKAELRERKINLMIDSTEESEKSV